MEHIFGADRTVAADRSGVAHRPRRSPPVTRVAATVTVTASLVFAAAACSGGHSSSAGTGSTSTTGGSAPSPVAYSGCMRSHGIIHFPDPGSGGVIPKADAQQLGVGLSQLQAAQQACAHLIPPSGTTSEQQQEAQCSTAGHCSQTVVQQWMGGLLRLAQCLRAHGEPTWPDPVVTSEGLPHFPLTQAGIDHHSPQVLAKVQQCVQLTAFQGAPLP